MIRFLKYSLLTLPFIICASLCPAQDQPYHFRHLTTKQGLPSNCINAIIKDHDGFIWLATGDGLTRFDGYDFLNIPIPWDSISGTEGGTVTDIFEDREGNFWIGTSRQGLLLFDRFKMTFQDIHNHPGDKSSLISSAINEIYQDREGLLWIGTDHGLKWFDPSTGQCTVFRQSHAGSLKDQVFAIQEDGSGKLWIGTVDGVFMFDKHGKTFTRIDLGEIPEKYRKVTSILPDRNGMIWFGTHWGLYRYDVNNKQVREYLPEALSKDTGKTGQSFLSNIFIESITESKIHGEDRIWIATQWGLNRYDIKTDKFVAFHHLRDNAGSLSTNDLRSLFMDDAGLLWIGTINSGINILNTSMDQFHEMFLRLPEEDIYYQPASFLRDDDGSFWIGGVDAGLFHYGENFNFLGVYKHWILGDNAFDERQHNQINCIYEDPNHDLWLGFYIWGLVNFDRERKIFRHVELQNPAGPSDVQRIYSILTDHLGILWIGTDKGLFLKQKNEDMLSPARVILHDELSRADIISIYEDNELNLWISTRQDGLFYLEPGLRESLAFRKFLNNREDPNGYAGNFVSSIYQDVYGTLWLGSDLGLNKYIAKDRRFDPDEDFNTRHAGYVIRVSGDGRANLWILHASEGLIRYHPENGQIVRSKVFDMTDGLPFDIFNTIFRWPNIFYKSTDGMLFLGAAIGTDGSVLWFHPDSIEDNLHPPPVIITGFNAGNMSFVTDSSISVKKHITLKYDQNFFSFAFAALDYRVPEKNQYAYYLEGFEDGWNYCGNRRIAMYTGVPPGSYTFRVKGSNKDGYWNETGNSVSISVLPPLWKTRWAYAVYIISAIAVIYSVVYFYLKRQWLLQSLALEQIESEKLKELDRLKTGFFTNISHEFRTPLTLILGPVQQLLLRIGNPADKQALSVVLNNAKRLKELVNQLLSLSKLESGKMRLQCRETDLAGFVRNHVESFESLAKQRDLSLDFAAVKEQILVYLDHEKMSQVLTNLLSNAFKFTPDGERIGVSVHGQRSEFSSEDVADGLRSQIAGKTAYCTIEITDTGIGIPPEKLPHIFDRFYQVDDSFSREREGTGIGLSIVKEMVNLHQGQIEVESREGAGTTFRIYLPFGKDHLKEEQIVKAQRSAFSVQLSTEVVETGNLNPETKYPEPEQDMNSPLLLIVEDNPAMRLFIRGYFADAFQIMEAGNGLDGMEKAFEHIPDVIISDVMMPKMDGYEMARKIKADERTNHIPVILLTARASAENRIEGLETGADDFVTKPFDGEELRVRAKNLVDQRKKLTEHYRKEFDVIREDANEKVLSMDEKFLHKAKRTVEMNLSDPEYGVERFAADMAMSRSQLHRKLSALVDQPVTEFIRTIRLNYAAGLLKKRAGTIAEIAYDAGFNSPVYFSISFKKQFGITPKEYLARLEKQD